MSKIDDNLDKAEREANRAVFFGGIAVVLAVIALIARIILLVMALIVDARHMR